MSILSAILRVIVELAFNYLFYWTGFYLLKAFTFGSVRLAPLASYGSKNEGRRKWHQLDWSIWLDGTKKKRALKAECCCLVGIVAWAGFGVGLYLVSRAA